MHHNLPAVQGLLAFVEEAISPWHLMILMMLGLLIFLLPLWYMFGMVAWQARRRGFSFWLWLLAVLCSLNPILILVVLALVPDRRKVRLRAQWLAELRAKLAARPEGPSPRPDLAISPTSVGDQMTAVPPSSRSVGDEETRLP